MAIRQTSIQNQRSWSTAHPLRISDLDLGFLESESPFLWLRLGPPKELQAGFQAVDPQEDALDAAEPKAVLRHLVLASGGGCCSTQSNGQFSRLGSLFSVPTIVRHTDKKHPPKKEPNVENDPIVD